MEKTVKICAATVFLLVGLSLFLSPLNIVSALYAPGVGLETPLNYATKSNGNIVFNCSGSDDSNLLNITLYTNTSGAWQAIQTKSLGGIDNSTTFSLSNIGAGKSYKWNCLAFDNESLSSWASHNYTFRVGNDSDKPTITLLSPSNNTLDSDGLVAFKFNVTDISSGIASCGLIINGRVNKTFYNTKEEKNQTIIFSGLTNGNYKWGINCSDNSDFNNNGSSVTWSLDVDDITAPTISIIGPEDGEIDKTGNITFEYMVNDYGYKIDSCSFYIDILNGTANQTSVSVNELQIQNFTVNNLAYGSHLWKVKCDDASPYINEGNSYIYEVIVNKYPNIVLNSPLYNSTDRDGDIIFNYTVDDDGPLRNCTLYHDINGTWLPNQTYTLIQKNVSLYFTLSNVPDKIFNWNVLCSDDARMPNYDWGGYSNFVLNVNKHRPQSSTIPNLTWNEDDILVLNLTNYFSDPKGDNLTYTAKNQNPNNVNITIDNETSIAILESKKNWWGNISVIFTAFDQHGMNVSSNNATFTAFQQGDTPPRFITISPLNNSLDSDGYIFVDVNITDDYALANVSLYYNDSGNWTLRETKSLTGLTNFTTLNITNLSDGLYQFYLLTTDNSSNVRQSPVYTINVSIKVNFFSDLPPFIVNTSVIGVRSVVLSYSTYLNNTLVLGNWTIREKNGEIYLTRNLSNLKKYYNNDTTNSLIYGVSKFNVSSSDLFEGNYTINNTENLNFTLQYFYKNKTYFRINNYTIQITGAS